MKRAITVGLALGMFLFGGSALAGTIGLPVTGQTSCYDATGLEIPCIGTGQDGESQAGAVWPAPRFAVLYCDSAGPCPEQVYDCDGNAETDVMIDNLTGLVWPRDIDIATAKMFWVDSLLFGNSLLHCGYTDWRIPNINEITSLIHSGEPDSAAWLVSRGFLFNGPADFFWSSTSSAANTGYAWTLYLRDGYVETGLKATGLNYALPVRSGEAGLLVAEKVPLPRTGQTASYAPGDDGYYQAGEAWPSPRLIANGDGTVTDNLTSLMWPQDAATAGPAECLPGVSKTWSEALLHVQCVNRYAYLGYSDWRLPNVKELASLIDRSQSLPALPPASPFTNMRPHFWTSTTDEWATGQALIIDSAYGSTGAGGKGALASVWPVRQGEPVPSVPLTVATTGGGSGTVVSVPAGIDCGSHCSESFIRGTAVTLTATASPNSVFTGWSGGGCSGTGQCVVTVITETAVTANFDPLYLLTVQRGGTGTGKVTSVPPGIDCGSLCEQYYLPGTTVTLAAVADPNSTFVGWSGGTCSGVGPCTVTLNGDVGVGAEFVNCTYKLQPTERTFSYRGGSFTFTVTATGMKTCPAPEIFEKPDWVNTALLSWRNNRGRLKLTAFANPSSLSRGTALSVGGKPFLVTQDGTPCSIKKITPTSATYGASGGMGSFTVILSASDCEWLAYTGYNWIHVNPHGGSGTGTVNYSVDAKLVDASQSGTIEVFLVNEPTRKKVFKLRQNW